MSPWVSVGVQIGCSGVLGLYIALTTIEERKKHFRGLKRLKSTAFIAFALGLLAIQTVSFVHEMKRSDPVTRLSVVVISLGILGFLLDVLWLGLIFTQIYLRKKPHLEELYRLEKGYRSIQDEQLNMLKDQIVILYRHVQQHEDALSANQQTAEETSTSKQTASPQQITSTTQISEDEQK